MVNEYETALTPWRDSEYEGYSENPVLLAPDRSEQWLKGLINFCIAIGSAAACFLVILAGWGLGHLTCVIVDKIAAIVRMSQ